MKTKVFLVIVAIIALLACLSLTGCGSSPKANAPDELDIKLREVSNYLNESLTAGRKIAFINVQSDSTALTEYIIDTLIANAVNDRIFSVVDRQQLDAARAELNFNLSGEVSDKSAQSIGQMLGAQIIVTGKVSKIADSYRFNIRALEVETVQVQGSQNWDIAAGKRINALIASGGSAATAKPTSSSSTASGSISAESRSGEIAVASAGRTSTIGDENVAATDRITTGGTSSGTLSGVQDTTVATTPIYKIGDTGPAGGLVFYDKGEVSDGWRYMEAAPINTDAGQWMPFNDFAIVGIKNGIGFGKQNTELIIRIADSRQVRAQAAYNCIKYTLNGYNDWFLPSKDELNLMYQNLKQKGLGNFNDWIYWSSSQYGFLVWIQDFTDGLQPTGDTTIINRFVRPVRYF